MMIEDKIKNFKAKFKAGNNPVQMFKVKSSSSMSACFLINRNFWFKRIVKLMLKLCIEMISTLVE